MVVRDLIGVARRPARSEAPWGRWPTLLAAATLAVIPLLLMPPTAAAGTAQVVPSAAPGPTGPVGNLVVSGAPGERNLITLGQAGGSFIVTDAGAPLTAKAGCVQAGPGAVRCGGDVVAVGLGDRDDRLQAPGFGGRFDGEGGPGADVLAAGPAGASLGGGPGDDLLFGGPGQDALAGGGGRDSLAGGAGNDVLGDGDESGPADSDTLDGGPGRDSVSYLLRPRPLVIDLGADRGGEAGEADALRNIESVEGGQGDDRIAGDDGPNMLAGGKGANVLVGRGGADLLRQARSSDAGPGNDQVESSRHAVCGPGTDRAQPLLDDDQVALDCEAIAPFGLYKELLRVREPRGARRAPVVRLTSRCERAAGRRGCRATVRLHAAATRRRLGRRSPVIGAASVRSRRGRRMLLRVRLTRRGRRLLRRHPSALLLVRVRVREAASSGFNGDDRAASFVVPLRLPS